MSRVYDALPSFAQNVACSAAGWLRRRERFTKHFWSILDEWEHSEMACMEELRAIQALRLAELIDYARRYVPHWSELPPMKRHRDPGIAIESTLADLPALEKSAYRDSPMDFLSLERPPHRWKHAQTSGTTGTPLRLWYSRDALAEEYASVWRMRRRYGVSPSDPHMSFGGKMIVPLRATSPPYWRSDAALNQTLFSLYHVNARNLPAYVDAIHRTEAVYVQGYPSSLYLIARALLESERPLPKGRLVAIFTSSESVLAYQRKTIEEAFGARLCDRYGTSELAVSMTACTAGNLHVDMEYGIVEVEVRERGPGWVRGPLLVTGFANRATPLLRYKIGDIGTRLEAPCPCGRPGDVFESIDGRIEDYVVTPDGRMLGRMDHVFKSLADISEAQIVQTRIDQIIVSVVGLRGYSETTERALIQELRARLGPDISISIQRVEEISREPNGKMRAVKSSIGTPGSAI